MKKIILTLLAAIAALSVDAQIIEVLRNGESESTPWEIYGSDVKVKYRAKKELTGYTQTIAPTSTVPGAGTCERNKVTDVTGVDTDVTTDKVAQNWVQLWPGGPKFANVIINSNATNASDKVFSYANVTAAVTKWGSNWRLATLGELETMISKCGITYNTGNTITINNTKVGNPGITITSITISDQIYHLSLWTSKIATDKSDTPITMRFALTLDMKNGGKTRSYKIEPHNEESAKFCILAVLDE